MKGIKIITGSFNRALFLLVCIMTIIAISAIAEARWIKGLDDSESKWYDQNKREIQYPKLYQGQYYAGELKIGLGDSDDELVVIADTYLASLQNPPSGYAFKPQSKKPAQAFLFVLQLDREWLGPLDQDQITQASTIIQVNGRSINKIKVAPNTKEVVAILSLETATSKGDYVDEAILGKLGKAPFKELATVSSKRE